MKRRSFCEWIPILPWPVWPLAWQRVLGQNTVVGSMTLLLAMRGNIVTRSMSGPPFALQLHCTTVWCRGTGQIGERDKAVKDPSITHKNIQLAKSLDRGIHGVLIVGKACDIPLHGDDSTAESCLQLLHSGCDALQHPYSCTFGQKPLDYSTSDP